MPSTQSTRIPDGYLPSGVAASAFDPEVLRLAAEAQNAHAWNHEIQVKTWVLLHLLDLAGFEKEGSTMDPVDGWADEIVMGGKQAALDIADRNGAEAAIDALLVLLVRRGSCRVDVEMQMEVDRAALERVTRARPREFRA
jgi:hypothetical protein